MLLEGVVDNPRAVFQQALCEVLNCRATQSAMNAPIILSWCGMTGCRVSLKENLW